MRLLIAAVALAASAGATVHSETNPESATPPPGPAPSASHSLSLAEAVERGLDHNLAVLLAAADSVEAQGAAAAARSRLRPDLGAAFGASRNKVNLEAYGFPVQPGESPVIGPFDVVDAHAVASIPLIDLSALAGARAAAHRSDGAQASFEDTRDRVVLSVSALYLAAVASDSRVAAARAQLETAQALARRAEDMRTAGVVAGVDVLRARVQVAAEQQRLIVADNQAATRRLALAQAIGLPLGAPLILTDALTPSPPQEMTPEQAVERALSNRGDWRQAQATLAAAEHSVRSANRSALPSLGLEASAGANGPAIDQTHGVYSAAATVRVPIYTGGLIAARRTEASSELARAQAVTEDLRTRIEFQVRAALLDLDATLQQTRVTREAVGLAETQLEQERDRFAAGVASGVEVVQAQQAVAAAHESYISSLLEDNVARVALARALGVATADLTSSPGGER